MLRQTIYYPYPLALKYARGRVLDLEVECETYPIGGAGLRADFARDEQVPFIDVAATYDAKDGQRVRVHAESRPRRRARAGRSTGAIRRRRGCWPARRSPARTSRRSTPSSSRNNVVPRSSSAARPARG